MRLVGIGLSRRGELPSRHEIAEMRRLFVLDRGAVAVALFPAGGLAEGGGSM